MQHDFLLQVLGILASVGGWVAAIALLARKVVEYWKPGRTISMEVRDKLTGLSHRVEVDPQSLQSIEALLKEAKADRTGAPVGEPQKAANPSKAF